MVVIVISTIASVHGVRSPVERGVIKQRIVEMVYAYEDSDWEIQSMSIVKSYTQKKKQELQVKFREIKMYGTIFNYSGFDLEALNSKHQMHAYLSTCCSCITTKKKLTQEND